jgi:hypothetical protein
MSDKIDKFVLDPGTEHIKVHGLQRSGTNYLAALLDANFEGVRALVNEGGWKHGPYCAPWTLGQEVHVLTIPKNPYAWLVSVYAYWATTDIGPDLKGVPFSRFIRERAVFERQQGIPYLFRAANPVQHWNDMNFHWLSIRLNAKKSLAVPYEALLIDPRGVLGAIAADFGLIQKPDHTEPGSVSQTDTNWDRREFYLKEKFLEAFKQDDLDFVNAQLDHEVMETLGYVLVRQR